MVLNLDESSEFYFTLHISMFTFSNKMPYFIMYRLVFLPIHVNKWVWQHYWRRISLKDGGFQVFRTNFGRVAIQTFDSLSWEINCERERSIPEWESCIKLGIFTDIWWHILFWKHAWTVKIISLHQKMK